MSKPNVRGKGRKDARISKLQDVVAEQQNQIAEQQAQIADLMARLERQDQSPEKGSGTASQSQTPFQSNPFTAPAGKVRRRQIRARAYTLYRGMGGDAIDQQLRNACQKGRCYNAQLRAAEFGNDDLNYGETITPYEDRMSGSMVARLNKEKRALLDLCLKEAAIDAKECEEFGADFEKEENSDPFVQEGKRQDDETPRLTFTQEEQDTLIDWLEGGQQGDEPMVGTEVKQAIMYCNIYPDRMPQELIMFSLRIDEATRKARAGNEPVGAGATPYAAP